MLKPLKKSDLTPLLPRRAPFSHKGQNGRVLVIGGSIDFYGAPILSADAALHSGADLVYLLVPRCNFDVTRAHAPDFIVKKYPSERFSRAALPSALDFSQNKDVILIGPGIGNEKKTLLAVKSLISQVQIPLVLDADAIQALSGSQNSKTRPDHLSGPNLNRKATIVITSHLEEFNHLAGLNLKPQTPLEKKASSASEFAKKHHLTVLLKGPEDIIAAPTGEIAINATGNPGMTVGGSGDVLSGLVASFIAQKVATFPAAKLAAWLNGTAGDSLMREKGFNFTASELAAEITTILNRLQPQFKI